MKISLHARDADQVAEEAGLTATLVSGCNTATRAQERRKMERCKSADEGYLQFRRSFRNRPPPQFQCFNKLQCRLPHPPSCPKQIRRPAFTVIDPISYSDRKSPANAQSMSTAPSVALASYSRARGA